jgi:CHASE2 domain-containing sensor protein
MASIVTHPGFWFLIIGLVLVIIAIIFWLSQRRSAKVSFWVYALAVVGLVFIGLGIFLLVMIQQKPTM